MIPNKIDFCLAGVNGSASTYYMVAPCRCTISGMTAACSVDPGDNETMTVTKGSTAIGVLAFGTDVTAGDVGTWTANSSTGDTVFDEGDAIKIVITDLTAAATFCGYIEIDQYARES